MTTSQAATVRVTRRDELIEAAGLLGPPVDRLRIDPEPLVGRWENTNPETSGITGVTIWRDDERVRLSVRRAGVSPYDVVVDEVYAATAKGTTATAFTAEHTALGMTTRLEANLSLGLLVIAATHTFGEGDLRADYFAREFYYFAGEVMDRP